MTKMIALGIAKAEENSEKDTNGRAFHYHHRCYGPMQDGVGWVMRILFGKCFVILHAATQIHYS